jgi:hypothetical protein
MERFQTEAPKAWVSYLEHGSKLQGKVTTTTLSDGVVVRACYADVKQASKRAQVTFVWTKAPADSPQVRFGWAQPSSEGHVRNENPRYCFELSRSKESLPWQLDHVWMQEGNSTFKADNNIRAEAIQLACAPLSFLYNMWLPDLISDKDFHVDSATTVEREGRQYVAIAFSYTPEEKAIAALKPVRKGTMLLDPALDWTIAEYECSAAYRKMTREVHGRYLLRKGDSGHPIVTNSQVEITVPGDTRAETNASVYELTEGPEPASADFTLAAFGLGALEPPLLPEPFAPVSNRPWLWALGTAVAALACLWLWAFFRRRSKQHLCRG